MFLGMFELTKSHSGGNVGYYDSMLRAAYHRCAGGGCVIITNPVGHRTQSHLSQSVLLAFCNC